MIFAQDTAQCCALALAWTPKLEPSIMLLILKFDLYYTLVLYNNNNETNELCIHSATLFPKMTM